MLVDTGADVTVLDAEILPHLKIDHSELEPARIRGVGGRAVAAAARGLGIFLSIGSFQLELPLVHFVPHALPLLGRDVLFGPFELRMDRFEIELRRRR